MIFVLVLFIDHLVESDHRTIAIIDDFSNAVRYSLIACDIKHACARNARGASTRQSWKPTACQGEQFQEMLDLCIEEKRPLNMDHFESIIVQCAEMVSKQQVSNASCSRYADTSEIKELGAIRR